MKKNVFLFFTINLNEFNDFSVVRRRPREIEFSPNRSNIHFPPTEMIFYNRFGNLEKSHFGVGEMWVDTDAAEPTGDGVIYIRTG